jgi:hypothetical protein
MVVFDRRTIEVELVTDEDVPRLLLAFRLEDRVVPLDAPPKLALLEPARGWTPPSLSLDPTIASCISSLNKSFATLLLCSDI